MTRVHITYFTAIMDGPTFSTHEEVVYAEYERDLTDQAIMLMQDGDTNWMPTTYEDVLRIGNMYENEAAEQVGVTIGDYWEWRDMWNYLEYWEDGNEDAVGWA